jgi:hypothetical protein
MSSRSTLELVSGAASLVIPACDGSQDCSHLKKLGTVEDFSFDESLSIDRKPTHPINVRVYRYDGSMLPDLLVRSLVPGVPDRSNSNDCNALPTVCLSEHQIVTFCTCYPEWRDKTIFLFRRGGRFVLLNSRNNDRGPHFWYKIFRQSYEGCGMRCGWQVVSPVIVTSDF